MKAKGVELFMKADYAAATKVFHEVLEGLDTHLLLNLSLIHI